jgi:transposase
MMLGTADRQGSLLGVDSLLARLFEGDESSFYARLAARGDEVIADEDFADCYASGKGRPSIPPSLLMRAVLCQIRDDVSDREAARRAAKDLDWKRALGILADEIPFHHTTLSVFRSRLLLNDADGVVLARTIERAVEAGLRAGLRKRARAYVRAKAEIDWADPTARRAELCELVAMARELLEVTAGNEECAEARDLLERVIDQDVDETTDDGAGPAIRQGVASDRVVSVVDPEMRHGRKSQTRRVDGYKAHVLSDHDTELVVGVAATPANAPDGPQAAPLVETARGAGVPIREVLGDTAYGDGDTRVAVEAAGAKVTAKSQPPSPTGKFPKTDFAIDPAVPSATCPAGHTTTTTGSSIDHKGRRVATLKFGAERCDPCRLRERCTSNRAGRVITLNFHEARLQAARAEQARPSTRRKLRRRSLVERKLAELKNHGLGQARYRGQRKVLLQIRLTAALVNAKKLFNLDIPALDAQVA